MAEPRDKVDPSSNDAAGNRGRKRKTPPTAASEAGKVTIFLSFTNEVSEWAKQTKERSVVKGMNFHTEKISPVHIGMQKVCLSAGKNGITFDLLHEIN